MPVREVIPNAPRFHQDHIGSFYDARYGTVVGPAWTLVGGAAVAGTSDADRHVAVSGSQYMEQVDSLADIVTSPYGFTVMVAAQRVGSSSGNLLRRGTAFVNHPNGVIILFGFNLAKLYITVCTSPNGFMQTQSVDDLPAGKHTYAFNYDLRELNRDNRLKLFFDGAQIPIQPVSSTGDDGPVVTTSTFGYRVGASGGLTPMPQYRSAGFWSHPMSNAQHLGNALEIQESGWQGA